MLQLVLTIVSIIAAMFFLGQKFYKQFLKKETSCGGCAFSCDGKR